MSERVLLCSVDTWDMADEKTGEMRRGITVWYLNEYREDAVGQFGFKPTKVGAVPELLQVLTTTKLPAVADVDFGSRPGAQNKATLTLTGVVRAQSINVFQAPQKPAS